VGNSRLNKTTLKHVKKQARLKMGEVKRKTKERDKKIQLDSDRRMLAKIVDRMLFNNRISELVTDVADWLCAPKKTLDNKSPCEILFKKNGVKTIKDLLIRMDLEKNSVAF
jgi:uncharacterized protein (DUF2384 family)